MSNRQSSRRSSADIPDPDDRRSRPVGLWSRYGVLRRRARVNSMAWWGLKLVQGLILGGCLIMLGGALAVVGLASETGWLSVLGVGCALAGVLLALRGLAAPLIQRWIVSVPENWYYVVEDGDGYTVEYLQPGRMIVPWRASSTIHPYVDFASVVINEVVEDVLDSDALPVDLEVSVLMTFNPTQADPGLFASLRKMTHPDQFRTMLARDLRDIVRKHVTALEPVGGQGLLPNVQTLESVIAEQLEETRSIMGLRPAEDRPVTVHVRAPKQVKEAYQSLWARAARVREESQTLLDIKRLAGELGLPFDDAFQLFYIMQRGTSPASSSRRYSRAGVDTQPVVVVHTSDTPPPAPAAQTAEHAAVSPEPDAPPDEAAPPRVIRDAEHAPDPFDLRRQRKSRGRRQD